MNTVNEWVQAGRPREPFILRCEVSESYLLRLCHFGRAADINKWIQDAVDYRAKWHSEGAGWAKFTYGAIVTSKRLSAILPFYPHWQADTERGPILVWVDGERDAVCMAAIVTPVEEA